MRTASEIKEDISSLEEILKDTEIKADEKELFQKALDEANAELEAIEGNEKEIKEVETKAEEKAADKLDDEIKDLLSEIEKNKKALESEDDEDLKELLSDEIKELTEKLEKAKNVAEKKVEKVEEKEAKAVKEKKPKAPKEKKEKAPKEKKVTPAAEKKETSAKHKEEVKIVKPDTVIIVDGHEYNIDDCKDAMLALKARKVQSTKSAKKYKTKKPATKAATNIETAIHQVGSAVTAKAEENPKQVIATFKEFKKKMNEAFTVLGRIISKQDVELLKKALKDIDDVIEKYK